jgi:hypothetical protein
MAGLLPQIGMVNSLGNVAATAPTVTSLGGSAGGPGILSQILGGLGAAGGGMQAQPANGGPTGQQVTAPKIGVDPIAHMILLHLLQNGPQLLHGFGMVGTPIQGG